MEHKGTQTLETERLILRRFEPNDAKAMFANWASDSEVTKYLTWKTHESVEDSAAIIKAWAGGYSDKRFYQWAIVPKDLNEPIGSISAVDVDDSTEKVHIGYCIGRKWWRQGITSEAFRAVIGFFFDEVGVNRVESRHDPDNPNSGKVMQKCGLKYEGTLRSADRSNQGLCDVSYYGLLRSDRPRRSDREEKNED